MGKVPPAQCMCRTSTTIAWGTLFCQHSYRLLIGVHPYCGAFGWLSQQALESNISKAHQISGTTKYPRRRTLTFSIRENATFVIFGNKPESTRELPSANSGPRRTVCSFKNNKSLVKKHIFRLLHRNYSETKLIKNLFQNAGLQLQSMRTFVLSLWCRKFTRSQRCCHF